MRLKFDFTAQQGTHFGVVKTVDELLGAIPNPVDWWDATPSSMTIADGLVSAWTGANGRRFVQATAARQPSYGGNGLRMANETMDAALATMSLEGTQIGAQPALAIAAKVRISSTALTTDGQYIWACQSPIHRVMYRYTNGNNYVRSNVISSANVLDRDIPADQNMIGTLWVVDGNNYTLHVAGAGSISFSGSEGVNLASLTIGGGASTLPSLIGWFSRFGVWRHVPTPAEIETLLQWVG